MALTEVARIRRSVGRIEAEGLKGWAPAGTGFLVGPTSVLTALHVVADRVAPRIAARGPTRVVIAGTTRAVTLRAWDVVEDWALLELDAPVDAAPLALAEGLPAEKAGWWTVGYARLNDADGITAELEMLELAAPYDRGTAISLHSEQLKGTEVRGLSGAALLRGDVVYGIFRSNLEEARKSFGYLYATPIGEVADHVDLASARPNPYQGMRAFEEDRADYFFGRDAEAEALVARLATDRLAVLQGGSGSGKSSLLRAGLLPRIGKVAPGVVLEPLVLRPGARPLHELALALLPRLTFPRAPASLAALEAALNEADGALSDLVDQELHHRHGGDRTRGGVLLVVDQLEELYAEDADAAEVRRFLRVLCAAGTTKGGRVWVAGAIRDGFMADLLRPGPDTETLRRALVLLGPIATEEGLRELVVAPAEKVKLTFSPPDLPDRIARDAAGEPGGLPLLQYALDRLWQGRRGAVLHEDVYTGFGGVRGVIAHQAETALGALDDAERERARRLFLRLVWIRSDGPNTRRLLPYASLPADLGGLVYRFVAARLLVTTKAGVEIAHEALIREWAPLRRWVKDAPEGERRLQELEAACQRWVDGGARREDLLPPHRLQPLREWALAHPEDVPAGERRFLVENLLATGAPPEEWGPKVGADVLGEALDTDRPVAEVLGLVRAVHAAEVLTSETTLATRARDRLQGLIVAEARGARLADGVAAARVALHREGPDWLVALADREPPVRELIAVLLADPDVRPALVERLPKGWSADVRRRAWLRVAWEGRTTVLFVAVTVFVAVFALGQMWWVVDALVELTGIDRRNRWFPLNTTSLSLLAACGAALGQWRSALRAPLTRREIALAAVLLVAVDRLPRFADALFSSLRPGTWDPSIADVAEVAARGGADLLVAFFTFLLALPALVVPGPDARRLARVAAAAAIGVAPGLVADWSLDGGVSFVLNGVSALALGWTAAAAAAWAEKAGARPILEGPPRPSNARLAQATAAAALLLAVLGGFARWGMPYLGGDVVDYAFGLAGRGSPRGLPLLAKACEAGQVRACEAVQNVGDLDDPEVRALRLAAAERGCGLGGVDLCVRWIGTSAADGGDPLPLQIRACENTRDRGLCTDAVKSLAIATQRVTAGASGPPAWVPDAERLCDARVANACTMLVQVLSTGAAADPERLATARTHGCEAGATALCGDAPVALAGEVDRQACAAHDYVACARLPPEAVYALARVAEPADVASYLRTACDGGVAEACVEYGDRRARLRTAMPALVAIPGDLDIPAGFEARRLRPGGEVVEGEYVAWELSNLRITPEDGAGLPDLTWDGDKLRTPWCRKEQPGAQGFLVRLPAPLDVAALEAPPAGADAATRTFWGSLLAEPAAHAAVRQRLCASAGYLEGTDFTSVTPTQNATLLLRSWRPGAHDLLAELRTWPLPDGSLVVAWRVVRRWPVPPRIADAP